MAEFDKEMWEDFVIEVNENLEEFEPNLLLLEQEPEDVAVLNDCFRNMHSIKGAANFMGFDKMADLAHKIENIMDEARTGKRPLDQRRFDLIFKTVDTIRSLLKDIEKNEKETLDISPLLEEFSHIEEDSTRVDSADSASQKVQEPVESEQEDEELINIFKEEIKSLLSQVYSFTEEKEIPAQNILDILDDMIRVTNYMGKEALCEAIKEISDDISGLDEVSGTKLKDIISRLNEIFKNEVEIDDLYKPDRSSLSIKAAYEEDRELYEIFLDFFKEIGKPLAHLPDSFDQAWAHSCRDAIERLKSSANYMDYMEVVKLLDLWDEYLQKVEANSESYDKSKFSEIWHELEALLPGLKEAFGITSYEDEVIEEVIEDAHETVSSDETAGIDAGETIEDLPGFEPESLDLFDEAIDSVIDGAKAAASDASIEPQVQATSNKPSFEKDIEEARKEYPSSQVQKTALFKQEEAGSSVQTVRVNLEKVENLLEDVAELVVLRSSMSRNAALLKELYSYCLEKRLLPTQELRRLKEIFFGFSEDVSALERVVHQLQDGVMRIRMLPVSHLFNRFPRLVRDLSRRLGKQVELRMSGTDTTLDKQVMEQLSDPLLHIIRNAIDHGIEKPEDRKALGKPEKGIIELEASQEGNFVVIRVSDDGRGIDKTALCKKAVDSGLLSKKDLNSMDDEQIYNLIFAPGLSTASEISDISGRGVGLDVVKKNIESIGGTISVRSKKGFGTQITLRIPLTLAIIKGLVVMVGRQAMVIPVSAVHETFRMKKEEISSVEGFEIISRRQETLPFIRLSQIFPGTGASADSRRYFSVRVNFGELEACLGVDDVIGQQEIVIKPLSDYLMERPGFAGATILGDGSIALILDLPAVLEKAKGFVKKRQQLLEMQALGFNQQGTNTIH